MISFQIENFSSGIQSFHFMYPPHPDTSMGEKKKKGTAKRQTKKEKFILSIDWLTLFSKRETIITFSYFNSFNAVSSLNLWTSSSPLNFIPSNFFPLKNKWPKQWSYREILNSWKRFEPCHVESSFLECYFLILFPCFLGFCKFVLLWVHCMRSSASIHCKFIHYKRYDHFCIYCCHGSIDSHIAI